MKILKYKGASTGVYKPFPMFYEHQDEFNGFQIMIHYCKTLSQSQMIKDGVRIPKLLIGVVFQFLASMAIMLQNLFF